MGVKRYRKKPVEIQGVEYTGDNDDEIRAFVGTSDAHPVQSEDDPPGSNWLPATTGMLAKVWNDRLFAWADVRPGDVVLCGVIGEFYPCAPDGLALTWDEVIEGTGCQCGHARPNDGVMHVANGAPDDRCQSRPAEAG